MGERLHTIRTALHASAWTLLACSLLINYALWSGRIIRPEWVQDYVSELTAAQQEQQKHAH